MLHFEEKSIAVTLKKILLGVTSEYVQSIC